MRGPEVRIGFDGLAVVRHGIFVAIMKFKLMSHACVRLAVAGIDGRDFGEP